MICSTFLLKCSFYFCPAVPIYLSPPTSPPLLASRLTSIFRFDWPIYFCFRSHRHHFFMIIFDLFMKWIVFSQINCSTRCVNYYWFNLPTTTTTMTKCGREPEKKKWNLCHTNGYFIHKFIFGSTKNYLFYWRKKRQSEWLPEKITNYYYFYTAFVHSQINRSGNRIMRWIQTKKKITNYMIKYQTYINGNIYLFKELKIFLFVICMPSCSHSLFI